VRIDRQNFRGSYFLLMCLSTIVFGQFSDMVWGAALRHPHESFYIALPIFVLGMVFYILVFARGVWGAFGIEEIYTEAGSLRWTRRALNWTRIKDIPLHDITEIKAVTSWHRFRNRVEVTAAQKRRRIGDNLLRDEALELAQHLRRASGLTK
jgi:hypothetical protein